jgi:hypothetical protein
MPRAWAADYLPDMYPYAFRLYHEFVRSFKEILQSMSPLLPVPTLDIMPMAL